MYWYMSLINKNHQLILLINHCFDIFEFDLLVGI